MTINIEGLVLESKYPEHQFLIKGPLEKVWRDGFPVDEFSIIPLQFDRYLCEVDVMAREQEWNDDQREAVTRALDRSLGDPGFRDMWVHEIPKPPKPWVTYDDTHHAQIAMIAQATGTMAETLAYETRGRPEGPRDGVVKKLQELIEAQGKEADGGPEEPLQSDEMVAV
jgi:hypothetical protein